MKDYYYILGVSHLASSDEIKKAYKKLSIKFHPDKNDGDTFFEDRFKEIQEAYDTLKDQNKKASYDLMHKSFTNRKQNYNTNKNSSQPPNDLPVIKNFNVTPNIINLGDRIHIHWEVINATKISISGLGSVAASGTKVVTPSNINQTKFKSITINAENDFGSINKSFTIEINMVNTSISKNSTLKPNWFSHHLTKIIFGVLLVFIIGFLIISSIPLKQNNHLDKTNQKPEISLGPKDFIDEMNSKKTHIFSTKDFPEAFGADWQLEIPNSWQIDKSHLNVFCMMKPKDANVNVSISIAANKLDYTNGFYTIDDMFFDRDKVVNTIVKGNGELISKVEIYLDGIRGYLLEIRTNFKHKGSDVIMNSANLYFIKDGILFEVICTFPPENSGITMSHTKNYSYIDFFELVAESVVFTKNPRDLNSTLLSQEIYGDLYLSGDNIWFQPKKDIRLPYLFGLSGSEKIMLTIHNEFLRNYSGYNISVNDYLNSYGSSGSARMEVIEGDEILFIFWFSGGANCCFGIEAYRYDKSNDVYKLLDSFYAGRLEIFGDIQYPFEISKSIRGSEPSYSGHCSGENYLEKLYFIDNKFKFIANGNITNLEKCFVDFVNNNRLELLRERPSIMSNLEEDSNIHNSIFDILYDIYTLDNDINKVKEIYFKHCSDIEQVNDLWSDSYFDN